MHDPASWCKLDVDAWPVIAELLPKPWPVEAAESDLRWWVDRVRMAQLDEPSSRELADRWGWGRKRVRLLLTKLDPFGQQRAHQGPTKGPPRAQQGPTPERVKPENPKERAQKGPTQGPAGAQEGPHARSRQRTEDRGQRTEEEQQGSVDPWAVAAEAWSAIRYEAHVEGRADPVKRRNEAPDSRTRGLGRDLAGIVKHYDLDDVLLVFRWFERAESAAYLRDSTQKRGLDTIRRHFERYRNSAREWAALGEPGTLAVGEHGAGYDIPAEEHSSTPWADFLADCAEFGQEPEPRHIAAYLAECRERGTHPDPRFHEWTMRKATP